MLAIQSIKCYYKKKYSKTSYFSQNEKVYDRVSKPIRKLEVSTQPIA